MKATRSKIVAALWLAGALVGLLAILALPGRWIGSDSAEAHSSGPGIKFVDSKGGHNLQCPPQKAGKKDTGVNLNADLNNSSISVFVTDTGIFAVGDVIQVDGELMLVTSVVSDHLHVNRGHAGTTPATHDDGTDVEIVGQGDACPFVDPPANADGADPWYELSVNYDQDGDGKHDTYLMKSGSHARLVVHVREAFDDAPDGTKVNFDVKEGGVSIIAYSELCGNEPGAGLGTRANLSAGGGDLSFCP